MKDFFEYKGFVSHVIKALTVFLLGLVFIIVMSPSSYASEEADKIIAKEMVRQMQCAEITTASVSSKCGVRNGGISAFGYNLTDDYSARESLGDWEQRPEGQVHWTESRYDHGDRIIVQKRMVWTNQIQPAQTITQVYLKTAMGLRRIL